MAITSSAGADNAYNAGDAITLRLTFSLEVAPGAGAGVPLTIGANTRQATLPADAAGRILDFTYRVTSADTDADGIAVAAAATLAGAFGRSSVNRALPDNLSAAQASHKVTATNDYDTDNNGAGDGLIEVDSLAKLNANALGSGRGRRGGQRRQRRQPGPVRRRLPQPVREYGLPGHG